MVTMVDEIFDRQYQAGRKELHAAIANAFARFGQSVGKAFEVLVKVEYDAPWTGKAKRVRLN
ncbi:MAG TPA: hypothetical protein VFR92_09230 [Sphingomicrobium sp.]|jgi:hypothetical protein|nr:hypothetical protein [Sphingomicrobium sp.]